MITFFRVTVEVHKDHIVDLLGQLGNLKHGVRIEPIEKPLYGWIIPPPELEPEPEPDFESGPIHREYPWTSHSAPPRRRSPSNTRHSRVEDVLEKKLAEGPMTSLDLKNALEASGWSRASVSPGIASLRKAGKVGRDIHGHYVLIHRREGKDNDASA